MNLHEISSLIVDSGKPVGITTERIHSYLSFHWMELLSATREHLVCVLTQKSRISENARS